MLIIIIYQYVYVRILELKKKKINMIKFLSISFPGTMSAV